MEPRPQFPALAVVYSARQQLLRMKTEPKLFLEPAADGSEYHRFGSSAVNLQPIRVDEHPPTPFWVTVDPGDRRFRRIRDPKHIASEVDGRRHVATDRDYQGPRAAEPSSLA